MFAPHDTSANRFRRFSNSHGRGTASSNGQKVRGPGPHSHHVLAFRTRDGRLIRVKGTTKVPFAAPALLQLQAQTNTWLQTQTLTRACVRACAGTHMAGCSRLRTQTLRCMTFVSGLYFFFPWVLPLWKRGCRTHEFGGGGCDRALHKRDDTLVNPRCWAPRRRLPVFQLLLRGSVHWLAGGLTDGKLLSVLYVNSAQRAVYMQMICIHISHR